jgi:hypothetical protein
MESNHKILTISEKIAADFEKLDQLVGQSNLSEAQKNSIFEAREGLKTAINTQDETKLFEALNKYKQENAADHR